MYIYIYIYIIGTYTSLSWSDPHALKWIGVIITCIPYSAKVWRGYSLVNGLFSNIWRKKVWRINRSANRLLIVITGFIVWWITDDSPNSPNFPPAKLSCYTVRIKQMCWRQNNKLQCSTRQFLWKFPVYQSLAGLDN